VSLFTGADVLHSWAAPSFRRAIRQATQRAHHIDREAGRQEALLQGVRPLRVRQPRRRQRAVHCDGESTLRVSLTLAHSLSLPLAVGANYPTQRPQRCAMTGALMHPGTSAVTVRAQTCLRAASVHHASGPRDGMACKRNDYSAYLPYNTTRGSQSQRQQAGSEGAEGDPQTAQAETFRSTPM